MLSSRLLLRNHKFNRAFYSTRVIDKILIANRGEIACRIMKTARKLGIKTVAVYSDADINAMHVSMADEAYRIGTPAASDSYLRADRIIEVAKKVGAVAIHPGYGFLSENEGFADALDKNNLIFVGPPSTAIRAMGSKSASKIIMTNAGVPVVPGYHGDDQSIEKLTEEAEKIGYPVLLKAWMGGGGKGMRIVQSADQLPYSLEACKREAKNSFGDDRVLIEKYITKPRHIEIQVFADSHGNCVYLFERDCSVQRRHQKVIEEAPAPHMLPELRAKMGQSAVDAARAVGYRGAGTVEFIFDVDTGKYYFMEMNTRLQVEHPVTEMITKQDLVEWQIRVAEGKKLPLTQEQLKIHGHAFEARIYAENPDAGFLPGTGTLQLLKAPVAPVGAEDKVRVDTGVRQGDEVSIYYDPMIAKLIVWDHDRHLALRRLTSALEQYHIAGITTNIPFLIKLSRHPEFEAGNVDTLHLQRHEEALLVKNPLPVPHLSIALASWSSADGYRPNHLLTMTHEFNARNRSYTSHITSLKCGSFKVVITDSDGKSSTFDKVSAKLDGNHEIHASIGGEMIHGHIIQTKDNDIQVMYEGHTYSITPQLPKFSSKAESKGSLQAPMPGKIVKVFVKPGQEVKVGDPLIVLEAMKMEHRINAPIDGVVKDVHFNVGDLAELKANLVTLEEKQKNK
eukprot:TRINITY_DN390_c0_g1_i2.p1 TRINITY_DN390_c0_g1~~TRINITY_DN390_c0_g1_i2.p1  ORF type:complete len:679 (-),score=144.18 TRINITY_DN390_c0_g1_i2:16-2052(-)